ncbi:hypothetical protein U1Q18_010815 [Sarracenia purpurea var. burkii]
MVQNRQPESEARDGSSSEEEEEEGSSEENENENENENEEQEGSESESEEELKTSNPPSKKPPVPKKSETPQISAHAQSSSSDDSGSDSDSDSNSDSPPNNIRRADPNIKPTASKPVEDPPKATKKPRSKPSLATSAAKSGTTTTVKRQAEGENNSNRESKKAKRKAVDTDKGLEEDTVKKTSDGAKKQLFQRLWSEDDEIAILKGMIDYKEKKGVDPLADMVAFHSFIKKSLHVDVSKTQLSEKVRRLKKKYKNNANKGKEGEDRTFTKPHEQKAYELSKKVWGGESNSVGVDSKKANGKARKNQNQNQKGSVAVPKVEGPGSPEGAKEGSKIEVEPSSRSIRFNRNTGESSVEDEIIKDGLELISGPKKLELEEKWKKLRVEEVELYLKRIDLIHEQTKLVLGALKSPGN